MHEIVVGKIVPFACYSVLIWVHIPESLMALLHIHTPSHSANQWILAVKTTMQWYYKNATKPRIILDNSEHLQRWCVCEFISIVRADRMAKMCFIFWPHTHISNYVPSESMHHFIFTIFFISKMVFRWMRSEKQQSKKNEQKESVFRKVTSYLLFFGSVSFILLVYSFRSVGWRYYDILHYQHCIFLSLMRWWTFEQTRTLGKSIAFKSHALLHALSFYFLFKSNFLFNTI